jgi:autoinducer 2-degrading protein
MFAVTVNFVIKPEHIENFSKVMKAQAQNSLNREVGCHQFEVCFGPKDRSRVFLYELYTDKAAFEEHLKTDHFLNFDATMPARQRKRKSKLVGSCLCEVCTSKC